MTDRGGMLLRWMFAISVAASVGLASAVLAPSASALTWGAPTTLTAPGEVAVVAPSTAMDANGDAVVAWSNYHSTNFDCPCQARAVLRSAGSAFGAPQTLGSADGSSATALSNVSAAMDAAGDTIVVWDESVAPAVGGTGGTEHEVFAAVRPAGGSFGAPQQLSVNGTTADGGGVPVVAMDASGDAIVAWISGLGWFSGSEQPQLQVVRRPAGGSFSSPAAVTGSGTDGPFDALNLAMSPDGHAALAYDRCSPAANCGAFHSSSNPGGSEVVQVIRAAPGAAFGSPEDVSPVITNPGQGAGPALRVRSVAIDDHNDAAVTYTSYGTGNPIFLAPHQDEISVSDAGGTFSTPVNLAGGQSFAAPVVVGPRGETVAEYQSNSTGPAARWRIPGGSFGSPQSLSAADFLALSSNAVGASGDSLAGGFGGGSGTDIVAQLRPAGGMFGAPVTVAPMLSGDTPGGGDSASIDKLGDSAVIAWSEGTNSGGPGPIRAALGGAAAPPSTHNLSVSRVGHGSVTSSPAGISCGSACSHAFTAGSTVTLSAHPASGYRFAGWSGACTGTAGCAVRMNANETVSATFRAIPPPNTVILSLTVNHTAKSATVSFKGTGGVGALHFMCKLDGGTFAVCSSPKTYQKLTRGQHTVTVKAIDARGQADPTPAKKTFTV